MRTPLELANDWVQTAPNMLRENSFPLPEIRNLLTETYKTLYSYNNDDLVPKEIYKIISGMDSFFHIAMVISNGENFKNPEYYTPLFMIADSIKYYFLEGGYKWEFPKINVSDDDEVERLFDIENDYFEELF